MAALTYSYGRVVRLQDAEAGTVGLIDRRGGQGLVFVLAADGHRLAFIVFRQPVHVGDRVLAYMTLSEENFSRWENMFVWDDIQIEPDNSSMYAGRPDLFHMFILGEDTYMYAAGPADAWEISEPLSFSLPAGSADYERQSTNTWCWSAWRATVPRPDGRGRECIFESPMGPEQP